MFFKKIINAVFLLVNQIEEGNGNPLQSSCLENPIDRGAWQAAVHGVARTRNDLATKQHIYKFFKDGLGKVFYKRL